MKISGKKAYGVSIISIVIGVVGIATGTIPIGDSLELIMYGLGLGSARHAIEKGLGV